MNTPPKGESAQNLNWKRRVGSLADSSQVQAAIRRYDSLVPIDYCDYSLALSEAKDTYKRILEYCRRMEDKALEIIKYLGGATGIVSVGALTQINSTNWWVYALLTIPIIFSFIAIIFANLCRSNFDYSAAQYPRVFFENINYYGKEQQSKAVGLLIRDWDVAVATLVAQGERKSQNYRSSLLFAFLALLSLLIPFIGAFARQL